MKILATSDLHGKLKFFKKAVLSNTPSIVIIAGDIADRAKDDVDRAAQTWKELFEFCNSDACKAIDFVVVPGNHDHGARSIAKVVSLLLENVHYLDRHAKSLTVIKGVRFFGGEKNRPEKLRLVKGKADILVFHYNPTEGDERMGVVKSMKPDVVIYGHNHRSDHYEHVEKDSQQMMKLNVSTWMGEDERVYGVYLIDYNRGGAITADWKRIR